MGIYPAPRFKPALGRARVSPELVSAGGCRTHKTHTIISPSKINAGIAPSTSWLGVNFTLVMPLTEDALGALAFTRILTSSAGPCHSLNMQSATRKDLGRFITADPKICRGRPTFKGTRITVADVLADVERGLSWDFICYRWGAGKISKDAITEAVRLARHALLDRQGRLTEDVAAVA